MGRPQDASIAAIEGLTHALNQQTTVLSIHLGEGGSTLPSRQAAPVTSRPDHQVDGFLAFWKCHPPIFEGRVGTKRDVLPLEGSSGGSVMDERVAQQLGRQVAACAKCGKGHRGACFLGMGRCFYRHQPGHIERDCLRRRNKKAEVQISTFRGDGRS
ncbi:hypothetical protein SESBI_01826 [Sesbania bispinosa]|nr:hypothetical protein SESBI_01826 [Sesbania bispinosa]